MFQTASQTINTDVYAYGLHAIGVVLFSEVLPILILALCRIYQNYYVVVRIITRISARAVKHGDSRQLYAFCFKLLSMKQNLRLLNSADLKSVQTERSSMLTILRSSSPVLVMFSSMSVPICNHFYVRRANNGRITLIKGVPLLLPFVREDPLHPVARNFVPKYYRHYAVIW